MKIKIDKVYIFLNQSKEVEDRLNALEDSVFFEPPEPKAEDGMTYDELESYFDLDVLPRK